MSTCDQQQYFERKYSITLSAKNMDALSFTSRMLMKMVETNKNNKKQRRAIAGNLATVFRRCNGKMHKTLACILARQEVLRQNGGKPLKKSWQDKVRGYRQTISYIQKKWKQEKKKDEILNG